jgi:hypothetical protein
MTAKETGARKSSPKGPKTQISSASVPAFLAKTAADRLADVDVTALQTLITAVAKSRKASAG